MYSGHICDVPGILVGHATDADALTGVSAIYCPAGAVPGVSVRGGAVLFDLGLGRADVRPDALMGKLALLNAGDDRRQGLIGAGTGASVGKFALGKLPERAGLGSASLASNGVIVGALAAVNAGGDIYDPYTGALLAGAHDASGQPCPVLDALLSGAPTRKQVGRNTTIAALATNARLDKAQTNRLAAVAQDGFARALRPAHTQFDGDTLFALATGQVECDFAQLCALATEVVARAIANAGYLARERRA